MTRKLIIIISTFLFSLHAVHSQNEVEGWTPTVELGYAFGGNFYLNYLESNPMWSLHLGMDNALDENSSLGFRLGYEGLRDEGFLPLLIRFSRNWIKDKIYLHGGYALGFYNDIDEVEELEFNGGLALGAGYTRRIIHRDDFSIGIKLGYEHRNSSLEFSSSNSNKIAARSSYHYLNLGVCMSL